MNSRPRARPGTSTLGDAGGASLLKSLWSSCRGSMTRGAEGPQGGAGAPGTATSRDPVKIKGSLVEFGGKNSNHGTSVCLSLGCSAVPDSATLWTAAHQAPRPMGFSRQGYWSGLPCPSAGNHGTCGDVDSIPDTLCSLRYSVLSTAS